MMIIDFKETGTVNSKPIPCRYNKIEFNLKISIAESRLYESDRQYLSVTVLASNKFNFKKGDRVTIAGKVQVWKEPYIVAENITVLSGKNHLTNVK